MLLCDRCKKPIVGESKKLLDVCPDCYDQVMSYISTGSVNTGLSRAKVIASWWGKKFSPRVFLLVTLLVALLLISSGFAISTYSQYEAPFTVEHQLANSLSGNLTQAQNTIQTAVTLLLQYRSQNVNLTAKNVYLNQSLAQANRTISGLETSVSSLKSQSSSLENTVSVLQRNIGMLENHSDTFVIWNDPVNVSAGYYLLETVPDAFDYHDNFSSTIPVNVYYFNSTQFVQWFTNKPISGLYVNFTNTMQQSDTFKLGEGCGGYIVIYSFANSGRINPNVSATYDPSSHPTGSCSQSAGN